MEKFIGQSPLLLDYLIKRKQEILMKGEPNSMINKLYLLGRFIDKIKITKNNNRRLTGVSTL